MLYTKCTMHILSSHHYCMNCADAICMMSSLLQLMQDGWLVIVFLAIATCFWWVAGIQTHSIICKTIEKHVRSSKILLLIIPTSFWFCCYMYASRKIEESGNWDETFLTRHMRLSVYQACNKSLHWAMPNLWSWCSCSPLTSCFGCSCICDLIQINYLSELCPVTLFCPV